MKELLDIIFPTLSDELIIVISLIIGLLVTASLILFLVKKISPKTNISELSARTRSWWIMAGMFIGAVFISYNISYFFLAFSLSLLSENCIRCWDSERQIAEHYSGEYWPFPFNITLLTLPGMEHSSSSFR